MDLCVFGGWSSMERCRTQTFPSYSTANLQSLKVSCQVFIFWLPEKKSGEFKSTGPWIILTDTALPTILLAILRSNVPRMQQLKIRRNGNNPGFFLIPPRTGLPTTLDLSKPSDLWDIKPRVECFLGSLSCGIKWSTHRKTSFALGSFPEPWGTGSLWILRLCLFLLPICV